MKQSTVKEVEGMAAAASAGAEGTLTKINPAPCYIVSILPQIRAALIEALFDVICYQSVFKLV